MIYLLIYLAIGTYFIDKENIIFFNSDILRGKDYKKIIAMIIWPLILLNHINKTIMKKIVLILLAVIFVVVSINGLVKINNKERIAYLEYNSLIKERGIIYDKMYKILSNKMQIAKINDTSYYKNLVAITVNRKDNEQLFMKWVTENNPNINYSEVSNMYANLCASVDGERTDLAQVETALRTKELEYNKLITIFPNSIFIIHNANLDYKPIMSDYSATTNKTSVDNQTKIQ